MSVVHSVQDLVRINTSRDYKGDATYNAHAFPCSNQRGNANEEAHSGQSSPATTGRTEREDDSTDEPANDATEAQATSENHSRAISIANRIADEIGMCLMAESPFDSADDLAEGRRMCRKRQGAKKFGRLLIGKIETPCSITGDICGDDT